MIRKSITTAANATLTRSPWSLSAKKVESVNVWRRGVTDISSVNALTTTTQLQEIELAWNDLYRRAAMPLASLSFEWVMTAWRCIAEPTGARLFVVTVRARDGRLLLIWPMFIESYHRLWRRAHQICTPWDYNGVLVDSEEDAYHLIGLAWRTLARIRVADLITARLVPRASSLHNWLAAKRAAVTDETTIHTVSWQGVPDWHSYYRGLRHRGEWDRLERRLGDRGRLEIIVDAKDAARAQSWILEQKRLWLQCRGRSSDWLYTAGYETFLLESLRSVRTSARIVLFTLALEGQIIAANAALVDRHRLLGHHMAFDPAFRKYSPGVLLMRHVLKWAFERRLAVDFGDGQQSCKLTLANSSYDTADFAFTVDPWGRAHEVLRKVIRCWKQRNAHLKVRARSRGSGVDESLSPEACDEQ